MVTNRHLFFDEIRKTLFGGSLSIPQVEGVEAIIDAAGDVDNKWLAYMLATAFHEVAKTMQPIEEYGKGKTRPYGKKIKMDGTSYIMPNQIYYGRGFVQLTWYENYEKAGKKLGIDLLHNPELSMTLPNAAKIMTLGMIEGWFTGKKLATYFNDTVTDPINARRIINGVRKGETLPDKAELIASYYNKFLDAIV